MSAIDEAILIEISQRFRVLEDAVEAADLHHAAQIEAIDQKIDKVEMSYETHKNYQRFSREMGSLKEGKEDIETARADIEKALEVCREDLVSMQETIRRLQGERS